MIDEFWQLLKDLATQRGGGGEKMKKCQVKDFDLTMETRKATEAKEANENGGQGQSGF